MADPSSSWQQLTPAFQQASGGFGQYSGFWSNYTSATPRDISADPDALTVSYTWTTSWPTVARTPTR